MYNLEAHMADLDNRDYIAAIVIGTLLGVGASMIFRKKPTVRAVLGRELKAYGKATRKGARRAGRSLERGASDALEQGEELLEASREILDTFREEVAKVVADARDELSDTMRRQVKDARKALRRTARRI
jgi:hypothetical protein